MKTYIKGSYRRKIYSSGNYIIGLFKVRETNDETMKEYINKTVTFTGYFYELVIDDNYFLYGEVNNHPKYGFQYQVTDYERVKPEDKNGLIDFLSSDLFKGVGLKLATSIVDTLGEDAIDKILEDKSVLNLVPHITEKKINSIYDTLSRHEGSDKTIVYLTSLGLPVKDAIDIYNKYKNDTLNIIKNNIYQIIDDFEDIEFNKIDKLRNNFNISDDDPNRIKSAIIYLMKMLCYKNGDVYLDKYSILNALDNTLGLSLNLEEIDTYLEDLASNKIIIEDSKYYLKDLYDAENYIAEKVIMLATKDTKKNKKIKNYINDLENIYSITYNEKQKEAITKALENNILIITGGPGTGKTTIIKAIVEIYAEINKYNYETLVDKIALLAPTGRASKRMSESTLYPASTIHRFLKWNKEENEFLINEYNKDYSELVIVDEASMIDVLLFSNLLKGLTNNIKLIIVGDSNQLSSVGPGNMLKDLIDSNIIDIVKLDLLYRQKEDSYIYTLAEEIKNKSLSDNFNETKSDYTFLECIDIKNNLKIISEKLKEKDYRKYQIMAPMYMGEFGIDNLNKELQQIFNPKSDTLNEYKYGDVVYRENDKVIELTNSPDDNVYNGDIGIIKYIEVTDKKTLIHIDFDNNLVKYTPKDLNKIKHAYIISIHKSQGSEFDIVVMPISMAYKRMLYKKLIYTGITRAKKKLIMIGSKEAFIYAINNNNEYVRKTSLYDKIINKLHNI